MAPQKTKLSGEGNENHHHSKILFLLRYSSNFPCSSIYFSNDTSEIFHLSVVSIGRQHCETTCSKQAQAELRRAHVLKIIWENYETLLWISGPPSISHHNLQAYPNLDSHFKESWNAFFRIDNGGKKKKNLLRSLRQKSRGEVLLSCTQRSKHRVQGQKKREAVIILSFRETLMSFSGCLVLGFILLFLMSGQHPFTAHRQRFVRHITPDGYLEIEGK